MIAALTAEEANLLHARSLARPNGWRSQVVGIMQGLRALYQHTARDSGWSRLVEEIVPDFFDPATDGPLPGREKDWGLVMQFRVRLARAARRFPEAERLARLGCDWNRQRVAPILAKLPQEWVAGEKNAIRSLATSLHELSQIQREGGFSGCVDGYREALSLAESIQDSQGAAGCANNLGCAYEELAGIRDLATAERWYQRSLELRADSDHIGRGGSLSQLGSVAARRFLEALGAGRPTEECMRHFSNAEQYHKQALGMFPRSAVRERAIAHSQLGFIYGEAGRFDAALRHYRESLRDSEAMRNRFLGGCTRFNAALCLADAGRFADARDWAQAALRDYQACENAEQEIVKTLKLLEQIESGLRATSPPSSEHPPQPH